MKRAVFLLFVVLIMGACSGGNQKIASNNGFAVLPKPTSSETVATLPADVSGQCRKT